MTRRESSFATRDSLIVVTTRITGPRGTTSAPVILDTGAVYTTIAPELARIVGYVLLEGFPRTRVRTAVGSEGGHMIKVARFATLGLVARDLSVHVFDLGDDVDGLVGLNFLSLLNYEIRSAEHRILVEPAAPLG